jgi:RNA polymerase primary sigma factor
MNSDDELEKSIRTTIAELTAKERQALKLRFGIDISSDAPLTEVAKQFDITREKIRDIEKKTLERLRKKDGSDDVA